MRPSLLLSLACVLAAGVPASAADKPQIIAAQIDPNAREQIAVTFSPATDTAVLTATAWRIELSTKTAIRDVAVQRIGIRTCSKSVFEWMVSRCPSGESIVEIGLQMAGPAGTDVTRVDVRYTGPEGFVRFGEDVAVLQPGGAGAVEGAKSAKADDADISFNGTLAKGSDDKGAYNIDAYAGYLRAIVRPPTTTRPAARYLGRIGAYGQAKTSDSKTADPNSFLLYGVFQRELGSGGFKGPFQTPWFTVRAPGWEFDKEGEQLNFIVSPLLTLPVRFSAGRLGVLEPGLSIPVVTIQLGTEFVKPQEAALGTTDWRTRGIVGASFSTGYAPERSWLDSIELSASYLVRFLSDDEVYKDARHAPIDPAKGEPGDPIFELGSQNRPLASVEFTYRPAKWVGLSFKYEHGSEPPVFELTRHTYTVGVAFALRQTSFGRYAILKP